MAMDLMGKVIRVETPKDVDERKKLKERVKRLESLLADTNLELALERQYTRLACERAGIGDVEEFKKKALGSRARGRSARRIVGRGNGAAGLQQAGDDPAELLRASQTAAAPGRR
jgi:hypothetical protein